MPTRFVTTATTTLSANQISAWELLPVTILSDVTAGRVLANPRIRPLRKMASGSRMAGQALTAWCERADFGPLLHGIDHARPGQVLLADAGGCLATAYIGEILSGVARRRGLAGLAIDGAVRDIDTLAGIDDMAIFAAGTTARGPLSKDKGALGVPISFGGVPAKSGDIVIADNDGIAVIPLAEAEEIRVLAEARLADEGVWIDRLSAGASLVETFDVPPTTDQHVKMEGRTPES